MGRRANRGFTAIAKYLTFLVIAQAAFGDVSTLTAKASALRANFEALERHRLVDDLPNLDDEGAKNSA